MDGAGADHTPTHYGWYVVSFDMGSRMVQLGWVFTVGLVDNMHDAHAIHTRAHYGWYVVSFEKEYPVIGVHGRSCR